MRVLTWIVLSLLVAGCSVDSATPVRLGTNVWLGYEPLYLARHEGFINEDIVHMVEYANSSDVLRGLKTGVLDAGALTLDEIINLESEGVIDDFVIFHVLDISDGADAIIARPPIASLEDLAGKRVGYEVTALGSYFLQRAVDFAGMNIGRLDLVNVEIDDQVAAWEAGEVDALNTFDPVRTKLLSQGAVEIFTSRDIPGEIVDLLVVREGILRDRPEVIRHIIDGWFEAIQLIEDKPSYAYPIMDQRLQIGAEGIAQAYQGIRIPPRAEVKAMLTGRSPQLMESARIMQRIMLQSDLLAQPINLPNLFSEEIPGLESP